MYFPEEQGTSKLSFGECRALFLGSAGEKEAARFIHVVPFLGDRFVEEGSGFHGIRAVLSTKWIMCRMSTSHQVCPWESPKPVHSQSLGTGCDILQFL